MAGIIEWEAQESTNVLMTIGSEALVFVWVIAVLAHKYLVTTVE